MQSAKLSQIKLLTLVAELVNL